MNGSSDKLIINKLNPVISGLQSILDVVYEVKSQKFFNKIKRKLISEINNVSSEYEKSKQLNDLIVNTIGNLQFNQIKQDGQIDGKGGSQSELFINCKKYLSQHQKQSSQCFMYLSKLSNVLNNFAKQAENKAEEFKNKKQENNKSQSNTKDQNKNNKQQSKKSKDYLDGGVF